MFNRVTTVTSFDEFRLFTSVTAFSFTYASFERLTLPQGALVKIGADSLYALPLRRNQYFVVPEGVETYGNHAIGGMDSHIVTIDLPSTSRTFEGFFAYNMRDIQSIIIRATVPPTVSSNTLSRMPSGVQFYVPDSAVQDYLNNSSWGAYSSRIHPLSEFTA